jgi:hypothetical protein
MSYTSKSFQSQWTYNPNGCTHNDRIGQILARGADMSSTLKQQAALSVTSARALEIEEKKGAPPPQNLNSIRTEPKAPDGRGMVWVSGNNNKFLGCMFDVNLSDPCHILPG